MRELETAKNNLRIEKESADRARDVFKARLTEEQEKFARLQAQYERSVATAAEVLETAKEELRAEKERTQRHLDISFEEHRNAKNASLWPDPNSSVLSKIDFGVPLVELFKWLDVRDTLLGENYKKQDITAALALARDCKHPDAEWLTSIFEGKDVSTKDQVGEVFRLHQTDARGLCFAWWLTPSRELGLTLLVSSSEMGNAFACSTRSSFWWLDSSEEDFRLAGVAASQHERDGFYWLGRCLNRGYGCDKDSSLAKENYLIAAELGHAEAAEDYGDSLDESDPVRWLWLGRAALRGSSHSFVDAFSNQVKEFFSGSGNATVLFLIGHALKGNIDEEDFEIFGVSSDSDSRIGFAKQAISFYSSQIKSARLAVDTWTLVATRLHLIKDMRIYIGQMVWEGRFNANYKI